MSGNPLPQNQFGLGGQNNGIFGGGVDMGFLSASDTLNTQNEQLNGTKEMRKYSYVNDIVSIKQLIECFQNLVWVTRLLLTDL